MADIFKNSVEITIAEKAITVHTVRVKDVDPLLKVVADIVPLFQNGFDITKLEGKTIAVVSACATLSNADIAFIEELELDELLQLATAVIELNSSFFFLKLAPTIQTLMKTIQEKAELMNVGKTP